MEVITFQLHPYNPSDYEYLDTLSFNEIIHLIITSDKYSEMTSAFFKMIRLIEKTEEKSNPKEISLTEARMDRIQNIPLVFILFENENYIGHVYAWKISKIINITGFRFLSSESSITFSDVVPILLQSVKTYFLEEDITYLRVLQPFTELREILIQCGFFIQKVLIKKNEKKIKYVFYSSSVGLNPLVTNMNNRNMDYNIEISKKFNCKNMRFLFTIK